MMTPGTALQFLDFSVDMGFMVSRIKFFRAVGMNGDEDLGQDITMKGEKFHYS